MDDGRAPTMAEFKALFEWRQPVLDSLASVSLMSPSLVDALSLVTFTPLPSQMFQLLIVKNKQSSTPLFTSVI